MEHLENLVECILSGQVCAREVVALCQDNPQLVDMLKRAARLQVINW